MFIRNAYNYDRKKASLDTGLKCTDKTRTRQSDAKDADINEIVRRFGVTKELPQGVRPIMYGDFAEVFDFQTAQNSIIDAKKTFMQIPAKIRDRFNNDPQKFMEFCVDKENLDEMRKLGLAIPAKEIPPVLETKPTEEKKS